MLLGNKRKQGEEQNWCIVLNPLQNDIDKKRVARKISEVFSLSSEEALDLVSNTPIILLDNLTRAVALKVKYYFQQSGAEVVLTNDIFFKRKCYRTVWPEPPNLSFLNSIQLPESEKGAEEVLETEEALKEIRSVHEEPSIGSSEEVSDLNGRDRKTLFDEVKAWRNECLLRRGEVEKLQEELEKIKKGSDENSRDRKAYQGLVEGREKQIRELRAMLSSSEEKYEALKAEYRQARAMFEERMTAVGRELDQAKKPSQGTEDMLAELRRENGALREELNQAGVRRKEATRELTEAKDLLQLRLTDSQKEADRLKTQNAELLSRIKQFESDDQSENIRREKEAASMKASFQSHMDELQQKYRALEGRYEEDKKRIAELQKEVEETGANQRDLREKASKAEARALELENQAVAYQKEVERLQDKIRFQESTIQSHAEELSRKAKDLEVVRRQVDKLEQDRKEQESQWEQALEQSARLKESVEKLKVDYEADLKRKEKSIAELLSRGNELEEQKNAGASALREVEALNREKQKTIQELERQLEENRTQYNELKTKIEKKEAAERRRSISQRITEREEQLKRLVDEQGRVEEEIRQREQAMRDILNRQELVEKEIIEQRHAQRRLSGETDEESSLKHDRWDNESAREALSDSRETEKRS